MVAVLSVVGTYFSVKMSSRRVPLSFALLNYFV